MAQVAKVVKHANGRDLVINGSGVIVPMSLITSLANLKQLARALGVSGMSQVRAANADIIRDAIRANRDFMALTKKSSSVGEPKMSKSSSEEKKESKASKSSSSSSAAPSYDFAPSDYNNNHENLEGIAWAEISANLKKAGITKENLDEKRQQHAKIISDGAIKHLTMYDVLSKEELDSFLDGADGYIGYNYNGAKVVTNYLMGDNFDLCEEMCHQKLEALLAKRKTIFRTAARETKALMRQGFIRDLAAIVSSYAANIVLPPRQGPVESGNHPEGFEGVDIKINKKDQEYEVYLPDETVSIAFEENPSEFVQLIRRIGYPVPHGITPEEISVLWNAVVLRHNPAGSKSSKSSKSGSKSS
jgi:hypothetical protein